MKILKQILGIAILGLLASCNASIVHDRLQTGKITKDCTGTYIKIAEKGDYKVCNVDILEGKEVGETITFVYDFTKDCKPSISPAVCTLIHENIGVINIKTIK